MPVAADGTRADIIMDPNSTISRMNLGRLYEQYYNAAGHEITERLKKAVLAATPASDLPSHKRVNQLSEEDFQTLWTYLVNFYSILSPKMYGWFADGSYSKPFREHFAKVLEKGIYLYMPPDNRIIPAEAVKLIEEYYKPTYGPVTYTGRSGITTTTVKPVRIGEIYIMNLEKTGDDWTAVSSAKTQHFGVLAQVTNTDKYASPIRMQAIRALGEAEVRIYTSYVGTKITADIMDRSNNPQTHEHILFNILRAEKPTDIPVIVDRNVIPLGGSKPLQLVKHIGLCAGWQFAYKPYEFQTAEWMNAVSTH